MNRIMMAFIAVAFAFTFMNAGVYAATNEPAKAASQIGKTSADVEHLVGKDIKNQQGEKLGTVKDFLMGPDGRISIAIVSHGGYLGVESKEVAVPFTSLNWNQDKDYFTMNATKDKLAGAPAFKGSESLNERDYAEQVYGYWQVPQQQPQGQPQQHK